MNKVCSKSLQLWIQFHPKTNHFLHSEQQAATLSMRHGMTPEAYHAVQQQQKMAAVSTAQHRYETQQQHAAAFLQRTPVIGQAQPYVISSHGRPGASDVTSGNLSTEDQHPSPPSRDRNPQHRGRGVQLLLGNHPPDDILNLKCNICSETTYGSVHAFRKHFHKVSLIN